MLSFQDYVRATGDLHGEELSEARTVLVMHNKTQVSPKGSTWITLQRNGHTYRVNTLVVPGIATPMLSRSLKTSQQLGLFKIDGDHLHTVVQQSMVPNTASKQPSSTETDGKMNNDPILEEYSDVFRGLGCLPGEYSIQCDTDVRPVIHPPRKASVAIRKAIKEELDRLVKEGVVESVTQPTPWVSSMVAVRKKNNKVRICIDPRDLNQAIKRAYFPLSTIEGVATRLTGAKVFSVLDARTRFWQVKLDTRSSYLTTFNTPFGRYRWMRMSFGITSAPEVKKQRMQEITEGLKGV